MKYLGLNAATGRAITDGEHIEQSIADILGTPIGSRVARREYGSLAPELIDSPVNGGTRQRVLVATVMAIRRWEKRIRIKRVQLTLKADGAGLYADIEAFRVDTAEAVNLSVPLKGRL